MARYRAVRNIVAAPNSNTRVIAGHVLDDSDRSVWNAVHDEVVPDGTIVRHGSLFEAEISKQREHRWTQSNTIIAPNENLHDNLEDVFPDEYSSSDGRDKWTLADQLRLHDIWTLEDVAQEKPAHIAFTNQVVPLRKVLNDFAGGDASLVQAWIDGARELLKPPSVEVIVPSEGLGEVENGNTSDSGE